MTPTLQSLHRYRWWLITAACSGVTLGLVVLGGECVYRLGGARHWFRELHRDVRFWYSSDHVLSGLIGIYPLGGMAFLLTTLLALTFFFGSMWLFLRPHRQWHRVLSEETPFSAIKHAIAALMVAVLLLGIVAALIDLGGFWSRLAQMRWRWGTKDCGFDLTAQAAVGLAVVSVAWPVCAILLRRSSQQSDPYWRMAGIIYLLFISSGLILFITGMTLSLHHRDDENFWTCGAYTATGLSFGVWLWTLIPSAGLVFVSRDWDRWKRHLCLQCGYDLRGCEPNGTRSCPECGEPIPVRADVEAVRHGPGETKAVR